MITILGPIVNVIEGGSTSPFDEYENLHLIMNKLFI
jgi:hypothetical protein